MNICLPNSTENLKSPLTYFEHYIKPISYNFADGLNDDLLMVWFFFVVCGGGGGGVDQT